MTKKVRRSFYVEEDIWALYGAKVHNRSDDLRKHIHVVCGLPNNIKDLLEVKKEKMSEVDLIDLKIEQELEAREKFDELHGEEKDRLIKAIDICKKHAEANGFIGRNVISDKANFLNVNADDLERKLSLIPEITIENFQEIEKGLSW